MPSRETGPSLVAGKATESDRMQVFNDRPEQIGLRRESINSGGYRRGTHADMKKLLQRAVRVEYREQPIARVNQLRG